MKGAIIGGGVAALLDIMINVVSDNLTNPWAWIIFFVLVIASAWFGNSIEKRSGQNVSILGKENDIEQQSTENGTQRINVFGTKNKVKQKINK